MTAIEILELLKYGEHIHLECKKAEAVSITTKKIFVLWL